MSDLVVIHGPSLHQEGRGPGGAEPHINRAQCVNMNVCTQAVHPVHTIFISNGMDFCSGKSYATREWRMILKQLSTALIETRESMRWKWRERTGRQMKREGVCERGVSCLRLITPIRGGRRQGDEEDVRQSVALLRHNDVPVCSLALVFYFFSLFFFLGGLV